MSQLDFINTALGRIKSAPVTIPTEDARLLQEYRIVSRAWLTEAWWVFNTVTDTLVPIVASDTAYLHGFSHVFAYPQTPEVLRVHDASNARQPYTLGTFRDGGTPLTKAVFAQTESFILIYGGLVDEQFWEAAFVNAFCTRLAVSFAALKTGVAQLRRQLIDDWLLQRSEALRVNAAQQSPTRPATNVDMLQARWTGALAHMDHLLVEAGEGTP